MKFLRYLSLVFILPSPQLLVAAEQDSHRYTPIEQIEFTDSTKTAFDHSGKRLARSMQVSGAMTVENNGSFGNVTVARRNPDGSIETFCTTEAVLAKAWMAGEGAAQATISLKPPVTEKLP
jgi:hypothetical protein